MKPAGEINFNRSNSVDKTPTKHVTFKDNPLLPMLKQTFTTSKSPARWLELQDGKLLIKEDYSFDQPHFVSLKGILHSPLESNSLEWTPTTIWGGLSIINKPISKAFRRKRLVV